MDVRRFHKDLPDLRPVLGYFFNSKKNITPELRSKAVDFLFDARTYAILF
jgi:hypothetical protein